MTDNPKSTSGRPKRSRSRFSSASSRLPKSDSESSEDGDRRSSRTKRPRLICDRSASHLNDRNGGGGAVAAVTRPKRPISDEYRVTTRKIAKRELGEERDESKYNVVNY